MKPSERIVYLGKKFIEEETKKHEPGSISFPDGGIIAGILAYLDEQAAKQITKE